MHTKSGALDDFMALRDANHGKKVIRSSGFFKFSDSVKEVSGASSFGVWLELSSSVLFFLYFKKILLFMVNNTGFPVIQSFTLKINSF